ncbi:adenylosuccinate lyase [Pontivivens insulae]|uniref:Chitin-binding type-2 domain-containing protein n=1 Tax=Pontivivens insulae TaxID=1639689 RepID=A0A2R8AD22_9RHOB|nr:adenylosuccinate lyase [Pontivivens insulae]RED14052.1 hypothetical protein DFR53_1404 [Pontivivens insulae]SPF30126.1 hypothetical protein POI8812_02458 [Pontivivens insulae]
MKTAIVAALLILSPAAAFAAGCSGSHQAMSCADGTTYDAQSGTCVATTA